MSKMFSKVKLALFVAICGAVVFCGGGCNDFSAKESVAAGRPVLGGSGGGDIDPDIFFGKTNVKLEAAWNEQGNNTGTVENDHVVISNAGSEWMSLVIKYPSACDISGKKEMKITGYTSGEVTRTVFDWGLSTGTFSVDFCDANDGASRGSFPFSKTESAQIVSLSLLEASGGGDNVSPKIPADMTAINKIVIFLMGNTIGGSVNDGGGKVYIKSIEFE